MNAQSRYKNAPALDLTRECGIILLKGNAVVQRSDLTTDQGFLDDDRLGYEPSGHRAFTRKMYSTMTAQIKSSKAFFLMRSTSFRPQTVGKKRV